MSDAVLISVISAVGLILSGVLVELIRARKRQDTVVHEMKPNHGGSLRDTVNKLAADQQSGITELRQQNADLKQQLSDVDKRLVKVETYAEMFVPRPREVARGE
jgi:hypothetical protein